MSLQIAKKPYSVPFKQWILSHLFPVEFSTYHSNLGAAIAGVMDETFETDGVNISDGSYTLASDFIDPATLPQTTRGRRDGFAWRGIFSFFMVFLGLPSRPTTIIYMDPYLNKHPMMLFRQFGLNLIGGWDSDPKISFEKKFWQWVSLPIKLFVILPIKLLTFPIKFLINILKCHLEWLPMILAMLFAATLGAYRKTWIGSRGIPSLLEWKSAPVLSFAILLLVGFSKLPHLILGALYFALRLITLAGRAILSPEKSIRMAFNYGREAKIEFGESKAGIWFGHLISNLIGAAGALISMSITAILWILFLPLAFSFINAHFVVLVNAFAWFTQLPAVVATMTWFSQLSLITASLGVAHGALTSVGLIISSVFGPAITTLGALIGLKISVGVMITCTAIGFIGAVVFPALTKAGDFLSNHWASWTHSGPFTRLFSLCTPKSRASNLTTSFPLRGRVTEEDIRKAEPLPGQVLILEDSPSGTPASAEQVEMQSQQGASRAPGTLVMSVSQHLASAELAAVSLDQKEYKRPAQQGFIKSADDFGDLYLYESGSNYQLI